MKALSLTALVLSALVSPLPAQPRGFNYDEDKVPKYSLPDPLKMQDGRLVKSAEIWSAERRPELYEQFATQMFGKLPESARQAPPVQFEVRSTHADALDGKATLKQVILYITGDKSGPKVDLLLFLPNQAKQPAPAFLGLNFGGNHTVHADPRIKVTDSWVRSEGHKASEKDRGSAASRWQVETLIDRGYALATIYYGDIDPDFDDGWNNGVHAVFNKDKKPAPDEWGSIATWAWGLSRALDCLEQEPAVNSKQVAVIGHSRLGKTSLWAGASDERFALVISNNSGCGGAALSRREFGETVQRINTSFPHWFCDNFLKYNGKESELPFDQHQLIALMAPRPVYVASAEEDQWADPRGEFLAAFHASPVYHLFELDGLPAKSFPRVNQPSQGTLGYHIRTGKHDVTAYDWEQYLNFADKHFRGK